MSVLKRKRVKSQFEVMNHYYKLRRHITDVLLRDFGFSMKKAIARINKQFQNRSYDELTEDEKIKYKEMYNKDLAIDEWFVKEEREAILNYIRDIGKNIFSANNIMPQYKEELTERRLHQDAAVADCDLLKQEMQYIIQTLPVDVNKYTNIALEIDEQIALIKGWRKSDNKFKPVVSKNEKELSELAYRNDEDDGNNNITDNITTDKNTDK